jgi:histidine triad (HIT) family protein
MPDCIFCKIISGEIPSAKVYEDDVVIAFLDIHPITQGHTLVMPKTHHADLLEVPQDVLQAAVARIPKIARAVMAGVGATSFNVGVNSGKASGQIIFHLHFHIIPRGGRDDNLKPWGSREYQTGQIEEIAEKIRQKFSNS